MSIASPPQIIKVAIDTKSPYLWIVSDKCNDDIYYCCNGPKYHSNQSSTYNTTGRVVKFGPDGNQGFLSMDSMRIGNIELDAQEFLEAFAVNGGADPNVFSGVLGLAPGENSSPKVRTITEHMLQAKTASKFSLHFDNETTGQLTFMNSDTPEPSSHPSIPLSDPNKWQFKADNISVGVDKFCGPTGCKVNIDSSQNDIIIPGSLIYDFIAAIHGKIATGIVYIELSEIPNIPNLNFDVSEQTLSLNITDYSRCEPEVDCYVLLNTSENEEWTLGQPFLLKYDSEFNFDEKTITFTPNK